MTLIESQATEAFGEMLSLIQERVRRAGKCQISSNTIRKTLASRIGLTPIGARFIQYFVEGQLRGLGILEVSHVIQEGKKRLVIYDIDPEQLQLYLLDSISIST